MNKCAGIENPTICNHCQGDVVGCPIRGEGMFSQNNIENHIRSLEYLMNNGDIPIGSRTAVACAIRTLREEIPMRPIYLEDTRMYYCNECGDHVQRGTIYCANCGQKQDWSDNDD